MAKRNLKKIGVNEILGTNILEGGGKGGGMGLKFDFSSLKKGIKRMFGKGTQSLKITKSKPKVEQSQRHVSSSERQNLITSRKRKENKQQHQAGGTLEVLKDSSPNEKGIPKDVAAVKSKKLAKDSSFGRLVETSPFEPGASEILTIRPKRTDANKGLLTNPDGSPQRITRGENKGKKKYGYGPYQLHKGLGYKATEGRPIQKSELGMKKEDIESHVVDVKIGKVIKTGSNNPQVTEITKKAGKYKETNEKNIELSSGRKFSDPVKGKLDDGTKHNGPTRITTQHWAGKSIKQATKDVRAGNTEPKVKKLKVTPNPPRNTKLSEKDQRIEDVISSVEKKERKSRAKKLKSIKNKEKRREYHKKHYREDIPF